MLRMLPFVTVVGENSFGAIHFGDPGVLKLPYSKIIVGMGIIYNQYRDGKFRELTGIAPDIRVPDGRDAIKYLLTTYRQLAHPW
jgi:C-terminal processing protease CtpA/Prc